MGEWSFPHSLGSFPCCIHAIENTLCCTLGHLSGTFYGGHWALSVTLYFCHDQWLWCKRKCVNVTRDLDALEVLARLASKWRHALRSFCLDFRHLFNGSNSSVLTNFWSTRATLKLAVSAHARFSNDGSGALRLIIKWFGWLRMP